MRQPTERSNLRKRADLAYREYRAIYVLTNGLSGRERERADTWLKRIPSLPKSILNAKYPELKAALKHLREWIGAKAPLDVYEDLLAHEDNAGLGGLLWIPKWFIEKYLFEHYERGFPIYAELPPHARIGVDTKGILKPSHDELPWTILEAKLFEDMAALWNLTAEAELARQGNDSKWSTKKRDALLHAVVRAAYHLLEGYINGLAWDTLHLQGSGLNDLERSQLLEWDDAKKKRLLLTLRDKLLHYPKIAAKSEHPPLQENNCAELKLVLERENDLRHALIHPKVDSMPEGEEMRESVFFRLTVQQAGELVDAVIRLIRRMSSVVGDSYGKVDHWLYQRTPEGLFPMKAFE